MRTRPPPWLGIALAAFIGSACSDTQEPAAITPTDGRPEIPPELIREVEALDPRVDSDGDGLQDVDELLGWTIKVDETGRPQGVISRWVTSNPDMADTDGDGLMDGVERMTGADPGSTDTDGDGLGDAEEVQRWGTSPASVDSDGDSRGKDPDPSSAPDVTLYDAAELKLMQDPQDPDGPLVPAPDATNPRQGDTDGDGVWEYDENATPTRSSVIADVPDIRVYVDPSSKIGLYLNTTIRTGQGGSKQEGFESAFGGGMSSSASNTTTTTLATFMKQSLQVGVLVDIGVNLEELGATGGVHIAAEAGVGVEHSISTEFALEGELSTRFSQTVDEVESKVRSKEVSVDNGTIVLNVALENVGRVPCTLRGLTLQLGHYQQDLFSGRGALTPIAQLEQATPGDLTLGLGERITVQMTATDVEPSRMLRLMRDTSRMTLSPANYDAFTAGDEDYEFIVGDVQDRTATVVIDFGDGDVESLQVAAQTFRDAAGRSTGISTADILTLADIDWDADPLPAGQGAPLQEHVFKIGDKTTELYPDAAPSLGDPVPYPEGLEPGLRKLKRGWYAFIERKGGSFEFDDKLFDARLTPGDRLSLMLMEDLDRDGLPAPEERLRGTSDTAVDSDGDGLSDYFETVVGWVVQVEGAPPRRVFSDPAQADADGDGLTDLQELAWASGAGTSPWDPDTDHDGLDDKAEFDDADDDRLPLRFEDRLPPTVGCNLATTADGIRSWDFTITDDAGHLIRVDVSWSDGTKNVFTMAQTGRWQARLVNRSANASATARDAYGNSASLPCGLPGAPR